MTTDFPQQAILAQLRFGRDGARSIGELAESMNWQRREVEQALQALVNDGRVPVIAAVSGEQRGVYLAQTSDEVRAYAESLRRRLVQQYKRIRALRRVAASMNGSEQTLMFLDL